MKKDFEPFAHKGILEFVGELEGICPATTEFKDFFAKLKDYIDFCFKTTSSGLIDTQVEMSRKTKQLSKAMSALTKDGTSVYYWNMVSSVGSMGKFIADERTKSSSKEMPLEQQNQLYRHIVGWIVHIGRFAKEASEMKGKTIDLSPFRINSNESDYNISVFQRSANKTQGSFSLPLYLENFPKMRKDFEPFAYKGMLDFVTDLEVKCLASAEFKGFFAKLNDYMAGYKLASSGSDIVRIGSDVVPLPIEMETRTMKLYVAMSALNGTKGGTLDPWRLMDALSSMGHFFVVMKKNGSKEITFEERRELTWTMVRWARAVSLFVKTASEKKGVSIDISSFENYYNSNVLIPSKVASDKTGRGHRNVPKDTSANNRSNSTKPK
ncbi:unnamed protein product [Arabis nemorensis]|uniref:DUF1216 domain-containing protein n=1 Tax=Arabis nemorensis TaxID=586526 RepID=A0A565CW96_9BRAS|nr:unnamed protein product [Arabis nemorensis]